MHMFNFAHNEEFAAVLMLLARALLSSPFLYSGIDKLLRWNAAQSEVADSGLPFPTLLHVITVMVQLGAGLSVLIGIQASCSALVLCLFLDSGDGDLPSILEANGQSIGGGGGPLFAERRSDRGSVDDCRGRGRPNQCD